MMHKSFKMLFKNWGIFLLATLLFLSVGIGGCQKEGPAEKAGKKMDEAMEEIGDELEDAGDRIEDATD